MAIMPRSTPGRRTSLSARYIADNAIMWLPWPARNMRLFHGYEDTACREVHGRDWLLRLLLASSYKHPCDPCQALLSHSRPTRITRIVLRFSIRKPQQVVQPHRD